MRQEHQDFLTHMVDNFGAKAIEPACTLMRLTRRAERYNVLACNGDLTRRQQRAAERVDAQAKGIAEKLGTVLRCDGDPRGFSLKIAFPSGAYNTWGGIQDGWGIPAL